MIAAPPVVWRRGDSLLTGVIVTWFVLTALSGVFVATDVCNTPEASVLKWGFVLVTLFTGPADAMLYVLGCREPLSGTHEPYLAAQWQQTTPRCIGLRETASACSPARSSAASCSFPQRSTSRWNTSRWNT